MIPRLRRDRDGPGNAGFSLLLQGLLDGCRVRRQVGQLVEDAAFSDDGVHQVGVTWEADLGANIVQVCSVGWGDGHGLTIKLILDDIVEDL